MKIDNSTLLTEFYSWLKEKYETDLTIDEVKDIINAPFALLKKVMASGLFLSVRFTELGLFYVSPKKVQYALKDLQKRYESGNLPHNSYVKYYRAYKTYLDQHEKDTEGKKSD